MRFGGTPVSSRLLGSAAVLSGLLFALPSAAQTDDQRAGARAAATQGGQAFNEHRWSDAIDMFTRAESLVHSPVHLLYMARAYDKLNALVKERECYIKINNEDLPANASQPIRDAKQAAQKEGEALEPRIPYVSVVVQGAGAAPVTVTMDGVQVPQALVGVPRPVDPGEHRFEATAPNMDSAVSSIAVREARSETVVLTLHASATPTAAVAPVPTAPVPGPAPGFVGYAPGTPPEGSPPPPGADQSHGISPITWVAFGVGAVGLGLGTVFALQAKSKSDDASSQCHQPGPDGQSNWCTPQAGSLYDDARSARTIAIVGFVVGGVGVAAGTTLLVLGLQKPKATAARVIPWVGLGSAGLSGRF
jgi:hypothetical protein